MNSSPKLSDSNTISLASSSMLARLSISIYTGRMLDKKVTAEVSVNKNAQGHVGNYHKKLFSDSPKLDAVVKLAATIRNWHQANSLPWEDDGARLLPTKHFFDHREQMGKYEEEFNQAVNDFLADYQGQIELQKTKLADMFDAGEYLDSSIISTKFKFRMVYAPVPEAGDFRIDITETAKQELVEAYEKVFSERIEIATAETQERLKTALKHVVERLTPDAEGEDKTFRKSMLENVIELSELLPKFNITNDSEFEGICEKVKEVISTVTPKELRESPETRRATKNQVQEILSKMKG